MNGLTAIVPSGTALTPHQQVRVPAAIAAAGEHAARRFVEFFTATIRNPNTRNAYGRATAQFFEWCDQRGITDIRRVESVIVAAYIEDLMLRKSVPSVKQHLAALRMMLDWLVSGGVLPHNPAASVRGPRYSTRRGKTPVLSAEDTRRLIDTIQLVRKDGTPDLAALRDRALIGVMVYSFARVSAAVAMRREDYYAEGKRWWLRLCEKGGKLHQVPAHHNAEAYLDAWMQAAGLHDRRSYFFQTIGRNGLPTGRPMNRSDALRMIKRRAKAADIAASTCCHTFRATGITVYLDNGGTIEKAQAIAAHESPRTTKLYDRTSDELTLDEIERILI
jgi:site-specific recombinase XerD